MKKTRNLVMLLVFILLLTGCSSALVRASQNGDIETVNTLLNQGADIEEKTNMVYTPLGAAAVNGKSDIVKLLLDRGADVNGKNSQGWTALYFAAYENHVDIIKLLIERGASVNQVSKNNLVSALDIAITRGYPESVQILLENGADVNIPPNLMQTAEDKGNPQIIQMLKAAEAMKITQMQKTIYSKGVTGNKQDSSKSIQIGSIVSISAGKREVVISTKHVLKIGELVYVILDGNKVILSATFPMMTSTRCQLEGDDTKYFEKLSKGMPVYKY